MIAARTTLFSSTLKKTLPLSTHTPQLRQISNVGIAGLGLMGHGICQITALAPTTQSIIAYEPTEKYLTLGRSRIENSLSKLISKNKLSPEDGDNALKKINFTTNVDELQRVDLLVEAIIEDLSLKESFYKSVSNVCRDSCIFASNTSSLSISDMAQYTTRPERFVGIHFFNPVQLMKLVEVIKTPQTDPAIFQSVVNWVGDIGKVAVTCGDTPGFIVNRLLVPYMAQSMLMVDRGEASVRDIDVAMQLGAGNPMGPLHLADYVGLDTCFFILEGWTKKYPDEPAFVVPECLKAKYEAGDFGRKTGKGFYHWDGDKRGDPVD